MTVLLEINDTQLRVISSDSADVGGSPNVQVDQPAAAAFHEGALVFGDAAIAVSRTHPQHFSQRYLMSLSSQPLPVALGPARNQADLVFHHLKSLQVTGDAVLAVPGYLSNEQLGLLLGVCAEAGINVRLFVDTTLLYAGGAPLPQSSHCLDIEQHRLVLTRLGNAGAVLRAEECKGIDGLGANHMLEGWMSVIADEFVQHTRFDPLHAGPTEQQLFDQVRTWCANGGTDSRFSVGLNEHRRELEVAAPLLQQKLQQRLTGLDLSAVTTLAVTPRVQRMPGLVACLRDAVDNVVVLEASLRADTVSALVAAIDGDEVRRISEIKQAVSAQADQASAAPSAESAPVATHLLHDALARPLSDFADVLDARTATVTATTVMLNDKAGHGQVITAGASLSIEGVRYQAIRVN